MANEIQWVHAATGSTLYAVIRTQTGTHWNTAGTPNFEARTVANWADYDIALAEAPASSYFYVGTFPAISGNMIAGWYWVDVYLRAGATPAISDTLLGTLFGYWDGATFKVGGADVVQLGGSEQSATDLKDLVDTGYDPSTHKVQGVVLVDGCTLVTTVTTLTGHTAQTGDAYAIVAHTDYGNAKLVRSVTPANALAVDANNKVAVPDTQKVDVDKWKGTTVATPDTAGYPKVTIKKGAGTGELWTDGGLAYVYAPSLVTVTTNMADQSGAYIYMDLSVMHEIIPLIGGGLLWTRMASGGTYYIIYNSTPEQFEVYFGLQLNEAVLKFTSPTLDGVYTPEAGVEDIFSVALMSYYQEPNVKEFFENVSKRTAKPPQAGVCGDDSVFTFDLEVTSAEGKVLSSESDSTVDLQIDDRIRRTTTHTDASVGTQWQVTPSVLSQDAGWTAEIGDPAIALSSSDEDVATVDAAGQVLYVGDGDCEIIGESAAIGNSPSQRVAVEITNSHSTEDPYVTVSYTDDPGSVRADANTAIDGRLSAEKDKTIYTTQNHSGSIYVRNANCWAADLDLTCCSPWNSYGATTRAGTLISSRHIVFANHYAIPVGTTVRFVDAENNVINRTVLATQNIGGDIHIAVLSADVDCGIAKVLPSDWEDYIPNDGTGIAVFGLDQEEKALVRDLWLLQSDGDVKCMPPTDATRQLFYETVISGDSGNPLFIVIDDELVILTTWWYGGAGSGIGLHIYRTEINAAMAALDTANGFTPNKTLTAIDLSSYNNYGGA